MRETIPLAVLAFALSAFAQPAAADIGGGASVGKGELCYGMVPNPDGTWGAYISTTDSQVVSNKGGNTTLTCHFNLTPDQAPAASARISGFACGVGAGWTSDSVMSATPGGSAKLVCKVNQNSI